ncbi:MAG: signal recognition particle-docking protein FtsY [bacterium]
MFGLIKDKFQKIYDGFTKKAFSIFSNNKLDEKFITELYALLISADTGVETTNQLIEKLKNDIANQKIRSLEQAKEELEKLLINHLKIHTSIELEPKILLLVGVNGSGKTTFAAKIANKLKEKNKKVLLVAGDTFRAAATEQLDNWGKKIGVEVFIGKQNQDPASVIFDACTYFEKQKFDHIIIDTAGRLQSKTNLMKELEKIKKIISKKLQNTKTSTWLTIDSMLGQNSLAQAEIFNDATQLSGIVLTKLDGTAKGGIVFSVTQNLKLPITYVTFGEKLDDISKFKPEEFVTSLFE